MTGNWLAERETSNPDTMEDVAVSAIPYPSDGHQATYMECKPLFILADSKNKDAAFELATAMCSKEWQEAGFRIALHVLMFLRTVSEQRFPGSGRYRSYVSSSYFRRNYSRLCRMP